MAVKLQIFAIAASGLLFLVIFELLRRRRLIERYALLWLLSSIVLLVLASWTGLLEIIADTLGIVYPPNALFMIAFAFVLLLLLHFSIAISRLSNETKVLAQDLARLDREVRELNEAAAASQQEESAPELVTRAES
ncbi:MAG TPA: DUF2304 domain-containing protein [Solirubrobacterales bacterium]|nr:DUF2304 domain-containing protein [Solirubrobacterales bacterium]